VKPPDYSEIKAKVRHVERQLLDRLAIYPIFAVIILFGAIGISSVVGPDPFLTGWPIGCCQVVLMGIVTIAVAGVVWCCRMINNLIWRKRMSNFRAALKDIADR
jgi:hypothetical protein